MWVLFHGGGEASQEAYVGVRSGDGGRTWKILLAEPYFGVRAPFTIDSYSGPWIPPRQVTTRASRAALGYRNLRDRNGLRTELSCGTPHALDDALRWVGIIGQVDPVRDPTSRVSLEVGSRPHSSQRTTRRHRQRLSASRWPLRSCLTSSRAVLSLG